jgi:gamma-glutamylaminecyclotransferase
MKLFVFGTLKKGFPLHSPALDGAHLVGRYRTLLRFRMLVAGPWFAPMMFPEPGAGHRVLGELYSIEEHHLERIDAVESVGIPGNLRIEIEVEPMEGGRPQLAFVYVKSPALANPVHSDFLSDYQDRRFVPPWSRS